MFMPITRIVIKLALMLGVLMFSSTPFQASASPNGPNDPFVRNLWVPSALCSGAFDVYVTVDFSSPGGANADAHQMKFRTDHGTVAWVNLTFVTVNPDGTETYIFTFPGQTLNIGTIIFTDGLGIQTTMSLSPTGCVLGSARGMAFEDRNGNGKWDNGEPTFGGAWYKVTDGGNWYVCGTTGNDSTFGVPLKPGVYYILPVNLQGYRVTTPRVKVVVVAGQATLNANIGYIKDPSANLEGCDTYNPPRK